MEEELLGYTVSGDGKMVEDSGNDNGSVGIYWDH